MYSKNTKHKWKIETETETHTENKTETENKLQKLELQISNGWMLEIWTSFPMGIFSVKCVRACTYKGKFMIFLKPKEKNTNVQQNKHIMNYKMLKMVFANGSQTQKRNILKSEEKKN